MQHEQSVYAWYATNDPAALAGCIRQSGASIVHLKAADGGNVWQQYDHGTIRQFELAGLTVCGWVYNYGPNKEEIQAGVAAFKRHPCPVWTLNPEETWEGVSNQRAQKWAAQYKAAIFQAADDLGVARPWFGFTSCPSWDGDPERGAVNFPWEGFAEVCEFAAPQQYWTMKQLDQLAYLLRRSPAGLPVVVILPCVYDYDFYKNQERAGAWNDVMIEQLAQECIDALGGQFAGFSGWRADRDDYAITGMARAYGLIGGVAEGIAEAIKRNIDPAADARQRLWDHLATLPGPLVGTDDPSVRYYYSANFQEQGEFPEHLRRGDAIGLKAEYVNLWTAPGDEAIRYMQPELYVRLAAEGIVSPEIKADTAA